MKTRIYLCTGTVILMLLAGCSNDNESTEPGTQGLPEGEILLPGETSELAPEGDVPENPLSSTPGGDTSAIAGLWNARSGVAGRIDERYVQITTDGLYTEYDYRQDDLATDGNCYLSYGPLTLTPEDPSTNAYSLPDDRSFNATRNADASILTITFTDSSLQEWLTLSGIAIEDLAGCENIQE